MSRIFFRDKTINAFDIIIFLRQLATLIIAGIPIIQCCDILEKSQTKYKLRILIFSLKQDLLSGKDLSSCLRQQSNYFDDLTCSLIKMGEHTGKLAEMLSLITKAKEQQWSFKKRLKQALFYPCLLAAIAMIILLCMFIFIIPQFAELFNNKTESLPWLTRCIFYLSKLCQQYIALLPICLCLLLFYLIPNSLAAKHQQKLLKTLIALPLIKSIQQKILLARFARSLSMMFSAGLPINAILKLLMTTSSQTEFIQLIAILRSRVHAGLQLHQAMQTLSYFPPLMMQMIKIGEESGMLEQMLDKVADFFEADIDQFIAYFNQLLEPLIMLVLGVLIGGIVIAMYLPIFKLGSVI